MDSQQFEEICLDVMTTKEHLEYILNYPEKPLISTRFPKLSRKSLDQVSPIKISSPKGTVDSKYFIGQEVRLNNTASRRSPASPSSYSIALRHMMNGDLNPASPLRPSKDGTVQFVENLYSRLNATSTTPLLKTKTRPKTNTRFSYPMPDNMERDLKEVGYNGNNTNQTGREGEVSYVKSVINFYERKENVSSNPFNAGSRSSNDLKSSRSSGTTITTTTTTTTTDISTDVVVTNDVAASDIQETAADTPISNSSDYDSNGMIPLNTEKSDDRSGNNSSDVFDPQCQQEIGDPALDRPETNNLHQTIEIAIVESVDAIVETICTNSVTTLDSKNEDKTGIEVDIPIDRSQTLLEEQVFEMCDNLTAPIDRESNERQEDETTCIDDENTFSPSVSLGLLPESSISLPHTAVEPIYETVIVASPEASVEEMQGESKFSSLSDADTDEHANQNISESFAIEASETVPGIEELSDSLELDDQNDNFSEVHENLAESHDSVVQEFSTASNQEDIDGSESSRQDENQDSLLLGSVVSLQTVPTSYDQIISSDAVLPYADTSIVTDAYDSISSSEADHQEYASTVTVDNDNDSSSQVQSAVDMDNSNNINIVGKKQLQFVTVEYSRSNGGHYLESHTATLSEYNQQPGVNDSSVFEPVRISFDFEPIENSLECHEKTSNQSICVRIEIDLKLPLHGDEVERVAVVDKKPSKVYKPALFGGCRSFLNF